MTTKTIDKFEIFLIFVLSKASIFIVIECHTLEILNLFKEFLSSWNFEFIIAN